MSLCSRTHIPCPLLSLLCMGHLWWWLFSVTGYKTGVPSCAQWKDNGQHSNVATSKVSLWHEKKSNFHGGGGALETEPEMWLLSPHWTWSGQVPGSQYLPWTYPCVKYILTRWPPHTIFSQDFIFLMILLQSLVPVPHTKVHSRSLDDRSHVFTIRWLRSVLMFLSENYPFFSGFLSWWLHLGSHSDSQSSWILVYFPRWGLKA